jgi:hypothetical protein
MEQEPKTPRERAEDLMRLLVPWRPPTWQGLWAIRIGIVLGILVAIGYFYDITLWDWLKLLIVPAVLAAGGYWFNQQQQERRREEARALLARGLEIEDQSARDRAFQTYLDQIGRLLLDYNLRDSEDDSEVRTLARARTLTALSRLDGERKGRVLQFLFESGLISKDRVILDLRSADLSEAALIAGNLSHTDLRGANLKGAHLEHANLIEANLREAHLDEAVLDGAYLNEANLSDTNLRGAKGWTEEQLSEASTLGGATMPDGQILQGDAVPDGPTFEEWLKSRARKEDAENE